MALILADSVTPTLFQRLVFGGHPGIAIETLYSLLIVAFVFAAGLASLIAMFCIWWERKVSARIQSRHGPNRVGLFGILYVLPKWLQNIRMVGLGQSLADGL